MGTPLQQRAFVRIILRIIVVRKPNRKTLVQIAVVFAVENDEFVLLADGKTRSVNKPKRKRVKHIEPIGKKIESEVLDANGGITDGALKNRIKLILK